MNAIAARLVRELGFQRVPRDRFGTLITSAPGLLEGGFVSVKTSDVQEGDITPGP